MKCPKCNAYLKLYIPRHSCKTLKSIKVICKCGYREECIDWNEYIKLERVLLKSKF